VDAECLAQALQELDSAIRHAGGGVIRTSISTKEEALAIAAQEHTVTVLLQAAVGLHKAAPEQRATMAVLFRLLCYLMASPKIQSAFADAQVMVT
jgi:hypothetical protein